jgi:SEC-C motif-containing protein
MLGNLPSFGKAVMTITSQSLCPCGSTQTYGQCCQPLHSGHSADSAEALMRSRYCAFALYLTDYLIASWHSSTRPESLSLDRNTQWKRLEILSANNDNKKGQVHFKAYFIETDGWHLLEETSAFLFENDHWYYHSGNYQPQSLKPNRNDSCPCGSGKKYKKCCLLDIN